MVSDDVATVLLGGLFGELATSAPSVTVVLRPLRDAFQQTHPPRRVDLLLVSDGVCCGRLDEMPQECLFEDRFVLCAMALLMENNPYLNSTETFSTRCSTEPLAD